MMTARTTPRRCRIGCLVVSAAALPLIGFVSGAGAQQSAARPTVVNPGRARVPPPAPAAPAEGLDSLKDDAVIAKLSALNQTSLVNRLFDVNNVPKEQRAGFTVLRSLEELSSTPVDKLTNARRQVLVKQVVDGLDSVMPTLSDANKLMGYAAALIERGIEPEVNVLEYFGDNPTTEADLKPAVQAAMKLLDKVGTEATTEAQKIEAQMGRAGNDALADRWMKLDGTRSQAKYVQNLISYYLAVATDASKPEGVKERKDIAAKATDALKEFDTEESGVQPLVENRIAKLFMISGDFAKARKRFDNVAAKKTKPEPNLGQQFEARFFRVLTDVLDKKPDEAATGLDELSKWIAGNIPPDAQAGV